MVKSLLAAGAKPSSADFVRARPQPVLLYIALACGRSEDEDQHASSLVPLTSTAQPKHSHSPVSNQLLLPLNLTASLTASQDSKLTALHIAAREGHTEVASVLIAAGADPVDLPRTTHDNCTPLHFASAQGRIDCLKLLLSQQPGQVMDCRSSVRA